MHNKSKQKRGRIYLYFIRELEVTITHSDGIYHS